MNAFFRGFSSTLGLKQLVGLTGALLAIYILAHLLGNLQIFLGPDAINAYAATLKGMPGPLWAARIGLLAVFLLHVWGIFVLWRRNQAARPRSYAVKKPVIASFSSRSMTFTGLVIFGFLAYHLAHFTIGYTHPSLYHLIDEFGRHDVYSMMVLSFQRPLVSGIYIVAMLLLGMHLAHGVASLFQTAGIRTRQWRDWVDGFGRLFALGIVVGNIAIPLACLVGAIEPAQGRF